MTHLKELKGGRVKWAAGALYKNKNPLIDNRAKKSCGQDPSRLFSALLGNRSPFKNTHTHTDKDTLDLFVPVHLDRLPKNAESPFSSENRRGCWRGETCQHALDVKKRKLVDTEAAHVNNQLHELHTRTLMYWLMCSLVFKFQTVEVVVFHIKYNGNQSVGLNLRRN